MQKKPTTAYLKKRTISDRRLEDARNSGSNGSFKMAFNARYNILPQTSLVIQKIGFLVFSKCTNLFSYSIDMKKPAIRPSPEK